MSDGPIRPGKDSVTEQPIDIVTVFQVAGNPDAEYKKRLSREACPGYGSCGGMFTYNTMQTFIGVVGMQPLQMVAPPSDDPRRLKEFPELLVNHLKGMIERGHTPRDIVTRDAIRNAVIVSMAVGGSTNVLLHAPEIARAAGFKSFANDICTGETLSEQINRLNTADVDGTVVYPVEKPYKPTGGLRVLGGNLSPEYSAVLKLAGVEGGLENNRFVGRARIFNGEQELLDALETDADSFKNHDMVIVRYEGPSGAPGMPEMLDSTSRITTLCRERDIVVGLMTDARFSGGSVGLVIGHVGPEAALGGPIAFLQDGDEIIADLDSNELICTQLQDVKILASRKASWEKEVADNGGIHPLCGDVDTRLLNRMRLSAVSAVYGAGMHPDRKLWVPEPRNDAKSGFVPQNKYREGSQKAF